MKKLLFSDKLITYYMGDFLNSDLMAEGSQSSFSLSQEEKGYRGILAAMLLDAVKDAAKYFRAGLWYKDPSELKESTDIKSAKVFRISNASVAEDIHFWCGGGVKILLSLVESFLGVNISRGDLVRAAKKMANGGDRSKFHRVAD